MERLTLYVDFDGTLAKGGPGFAKAINKAKAAHNDGLIAWMYAIEAKPQRLNLNLLRWLKSLDKARYRLVLWTDRSQELEGPTKRNLGKWASLFEAFSFNGDNNCGKIKSQVDGFVIDDKAKYLKCGLKGGIQVQW